MYCYYQKILKKAIFLMKGMIIHILSFCV